MHCIYGRLRLRALAGPLAALWLAGTAGAEKAPPFAQLLRQAEASPRLQALHADLDRARGLADQARARPNPTINVYGENFAGSRGYDGFDRSETTLQLNQPIELGGKRTARIAAGEAEVVAVQARGHEGRIAYAFELARAYAAVELAGKRIERVQDEVEETEAVLKAARALVEAGKEARLRQLQAETELSSKQAELVAAKADWTLALARLSATAGVDTPFTDVSESLLGRLDAAPASGPIDPLQNAAVLSAEAERTAAERRLKVERRRAIPDVTAQFGVRRLEADNASALVAGVSVPLNLFDRNKGNIAAAAAEVRGAEARSAAARLEAQGAVRSAAIQVQAADARSIAAARTVATAEETYRLARIAYEAGKAPLIELLAARHELGGARDIQIDAAAARFEARATLARLQGLTVTGDPVQ